MPKPPVPAVVQAFLGLPNPAVIASVKPDGAPHSAATWYLWDDGRVLVNMADTRKRLDYLRHNPHVSLTVLSQDSWYRHITIEGRVVSLEQDADLGPIDRVSRHYTGAEYRARDQVRWSAWIEVDHWHGWENGKPWPPREQG
jgi:PPOX class probable F420-dependent enzyme